MEHIETFASSFRDLTGHTPMTWQRRLFHEHFVRGAAHLPSSLDIPTGLGKTSVMAIWYLAHKAGAILPRRLVYVVDRRAIVDQATSIAESMAKQDEPLAVSTLRGQYVDNRLWLNDPASLAIVVGTVDMVGSRLLFRGYGVSKRMRSYHAGLLGADALVVLDEAHLVPPFEALMRAVAHETTRFGPRGGERASLVPPFRLLSLSATGRQSDDRTFKLDGFDFDDPVVATRLDAPKRLKVEPLVEAAALVATLAERAWQRGRGGRRVIVFCNSRKTATAVHQALSERLSKPIRAAQDTSSVDMAGGVELLVGARRVFERISLAESDTFKRFSSENEGSRQPAFLVCTSAGEVGVDLDADHVVCDLVPWERMVQRLGRVNRRGGFDKSLIDVFPAPADKEAETAADKQTLVRWLAPFKSVIWSAGDDGRLDASPRALGRLRADNDFRHLAAEATTPAPLRPALTRPLVDAWSMTSLDEHPGRPEDVTPWLRGWITGDPPQTSVVWRRFLPVRQEGTVSDAEVTAFFEAAPPHLSEMLETETWRVVDWLVARTVELEAKDDTHAFGPNDTVAFALSGGGELQERWSIASLVRTKGSKRLHDRLQRQLAGAVLIVDTRLRGLVAGLLKDDGEEDVPTADRDGWLPDGADGFPAVGFRIRPGGTPPARDTYRFVTRTNADGEALDWLYIETWSSEDSRATAPNPQSLVEHQDWTRQCAVAIAESVGLSGSYKEALAVAGRLHDEGKRAAAWQAAFNARPEGGPYAKTRGPINYRRLDGYRHEFGSLPYAQSDSGFQALPDALKDLALHIVAAHHGRARPLIEIDGCEDSPPSVLRARAREVAERFARLQKEWGPWGLAWWEALLRAADQKASRMNDERPSLADESVRAREIA